MRIRTQTYPPHRDLASERKEKDGKIANSKRFSWNFLSSRYIDTMRSRQRCAVLQVPFQELSFAAESVCVYRNIMGGTNI